MARQRGIGHNPTLDNIYQTNINSLIDDINRLEALKKESQKKGDTNTVDKCDEQLEDNAIKKKKKKKKKLIFSLPPYDIRGTVFPIFEKNVFFSISISSCIFKIRKN